MNFQRFFLSNLNRSPPTCVDINECDDLSTCQIDTGNPANCTNNNGGFECSCLAGFSADSNGFCSDNNECLDDPCNIAG